MSDDEETLNDFFDKKSAKKKSKKSKKKDKTEDKDSNEDGGMVTLKTKTTSQKDEWKDFEDPKEKDYSHLKIADLQISDEKNEETIEDEEVEEDEEGNPIRKADTVWNPTPDASQPPETAAPAPARDPNPAMTNVVSGKYIAPSQRRAMMGMGDSPAQRRTRANVMPDIKDQGAFPTLGAANQAPKSASMTQGGYTEVTKGTRSQDARQQDTRPRLEMGNRFDGLGR